MNKSQPPAKKKELNSEGIHTKKEDDAVGSLFVNSENSAIDRREDLFIHSIWRTRMDNFKNNLNIFGYATTVYHSMRWKENSLEVNQRVINNHINQSIIVQPNKRNM